MHLACHFIVPCVYCAIYVAEVYIALTTMLLKSWGLWSGVTSSEVMLASSKVEFKLCKLQVTHDMTQLRFMSRMYICE